MSTEWTTQVPMIADGQPVRASVANAPLQVLIDRTDAVKAVLDSIEAGQQLLLRDQAMGTDVAVGNMVYLSSDTLLYEKTIAQWEELARAVMVAPHTHSDALTPAESAVHTGLVISKPTSGSGHILMGGTGFLETTDILTLFGTSTPTAGIYYLAAISAGQVETTPPGIRVLSVRYLGDGIVQVLPFHFDPVTHTHRSYSLIKYDWALAAGFDPAIVPVGASHGYNTNTPDALAQNISAAFLPAAGDPVFVMEQIIDGATYGTHIVADDISITPDGIWWFGGSVPYGTIDMRMTSADTHGMSLIHTLETADPDVIGVAAQNGIVTLSYNDLPVDDDIAGHEVIKSITDRRIKRGPVVSSATAGVGVNISSPEGDGVGDVLIEMGLLSNPRIEASMQNLNNAITVVEDPFVFTKFPVSRVSSVSCKATLPTLADESRYICRIFAMFLNPDSGQAAPVVEGVWLVPTPDTSGVVPYNATSWNLTFPVFPTTIAGSVYYVETNSFALTGFSRGLVVYTLKADAPSAPLNMVSTGIILEPV